MVTESANKPSLSMAAKVKNLQNNSKFHKHVTTFYELSANSSSRAFLLEGEGRNFEDARAGT